MADLTLDEVREIGIAAARRVIGDTFTSVEVGAEQDRLEREAYVLTLRSPSEAEWQNASNEAVRIMTTMIDSLWERGDTRFPHVRLLSDGSWTSARRAAAE